MRFPLEWTIVLREYFSAANAIGPYIVARFVCNLPLGYGPFLLATVIYWMTGARAFEIACFDERRTTEDP